jgi:hypothetical protein
MAFSGDALRRIGEMPQAVQNRSPDLKFTLAENSNRLAESENVSLLQSFID